MSQTAVNPKTIPQENPMGYAPINKMLLQLGIPMMASMLVQALYNVVDSIFVSHVSEAALSAVGLAFPAQSLMMSFGIGTAVGVNALLSKSLGSKEFDLANQVAGNGLILNGITCVVFMLFGLFGVRPFIGSQTTDAAILTAGVDYLSVCCVFSGGMYLQVMSEKLLVATGRSKLAMISQMTGAISNIVLDPIFIFGMFGLPAMGAKGAAVATVAGQWLGAAVSMYFNLKHNPEITLNRKAFRLKGKVVYKIYQVGAPSIAMQSIGSVMTFLLNKILIGFTSTAVAVFSIYFKLQSFVFMPVFGLNNGMVPLTSYNYGARNPKRISETIKISMIYASAIMFVGFLLFQFAPGLLLSIFNASPEMLGIGIPAMRIICFNFLIAGVNIICTSAFQALGKGMLALWVSIARQLVVLIPAAWLLSMTGVLNLVWLAFPMSEVASLIISLVFLRGCYKDIIDPMYAEQAQA